MAAHTPWEFFKNVIPGGDAHYVISDATGKWILSAVYPTEIHQVEDRLKTIVTAVNAHDEMVSILEAFVDGVEKGRTFHAVNGGTWKRAKLVLAKVEA